MKKILLSMPWAPSIVTELDKYLDEMRSLGFEVTVDPKQKRLTEQEVIERTPGFDALVCGGDALTKAAIDSMDTVKIISRIGVGVDTVDIPAATAKGIAVSNTPGANAEGVAEFAATMILALARKIIPANMIAHTGGWTKANGVSLFRKTLGIIGLGNIGKLLAKILSGFDMEVLAFDMYQDEAYAQAHNIKYVSLDELLTRSDFISVHSPLTPETRNLISDSAFEKMKPSAFIVNCARGGIVDEKALYKALTEKKIAGAGLDVFDQEPVEPDNPLLTLDNVICTPHNAGSCVEAKNNMVYLGLKNAADYLSGRPFKGFLNQKELQQ